MLRGKSALQLVPVLPPLTVQVIPAGLEVTVPLPLDPPCTASGNELGGGPNTAVTCRVAFIVIWQESGLSVTSSSHPVQETTPPGTGVAWIRITVPLFRSLAHDPLVETRPPATVIVHLSPFRSETSVPSEVLPVPDNVSLNFVRPPGPPLAASIDSETFGSVGWSLQAWSSIVAVTIMAATPTAMRLGRECDMMPRSYEL